MTTRQALELKESTEIYWQACEQVGKLIPDLMIETFKKNQFWKGKIMLKSNFYFNGDMDFYPLILKMTPKRPKLYQQNHSSN